MNCRDKTETCKKETEIEGGTVADNIVVSKTERKLERMANKAHYIGNLIAALGDPSEWEYTGECVDAGKDSTQKCACGHSIRYVFYIKRPRDSATNQVGSTCIDHFQGINPALYENLKQAEEKMKKRLAEMKKKAKEAKQQAEVERLEQAYKAKRQALVELYNKYRGGDTSYYARYRIPPWLYELFNWRRRRFIPFEAPRYQRKTDYIRWYNEKIKWIDELVGKHSVEFEARKINYPFGIPEPPEEKEGEE